MKQTRFVAALAALVAIAPLAAMASPVQVFTVENTLSGWSAQGLRDAQGRVVVPPGGTFTPLPGGGFLRDQLTRYDLFDADGRQTGGPYAYAELPAPDAGALIVGKDGRPGLDDATGGLLDTHGKELLPPVYGHVAYLPGTGLFAIERARRWGLVDAHGTVLVQPTFDTAADAPGAVLVSRRGQQGLVGRDGQFVVPFGMADIQPVKDGVKSVDRFTVCESGDGAKPGCRVIDAQGQTLLGGMRVDAVEYARNLQRWMVMHRDPPRDPSADASDEGSVSALLLDESGKTVARFDCGSSGSLTRIGELIVAGRPTAGGGDCLVGLVDRDGKWVVQPEYASIARLYDAAWRDPAHDDPAPVEYLVTSAAKDGDTKRGILDANGNRILAAAYYNITERYPQLGLYVAARSDREWGVVDRDGRWRVPPVYGGLAPNADLPLPFRLFVKSGKTDDDDRYVLHDLRSGRQVFTQSYRYLSFQYDFRWKSLGLPWTEYVVIVAQRPDKKTGVIDFSGRTVVPFQYDNIEALGDWGDMRATKNDKDVTIMGLPAAKAAAVRDAISRAMRGGQAPIANALSPYMGRFAPVDYLDTAALNDAVAKKRLARPVAPMMLLDANTAIMDFSMITSKAAPAYDFLEYYCPRDAGFDVLMPGADTSDKACGDPRSPMLKFRRTTQDDWRCDGCERRGLPVLWRRLDARAEKQ
ncbi:WG repeat-containing protein [Burkholderia stagnalis]